MNGGPEKGRFIFVVFVVFILFIFLLIFY